MIDLRPQAVALWHRLSVRDRRLLAAALLVTVVATEALLVWPLHLRRLAVEQASGGENVAREKAREERAAHAEQTRSTLNQALTKAQAELRQMGSGGSQREPLARLLQRTVAGHELALRGLRALPVEAVVAATAAPSVDAAAEAAPSVAAAASAAAVPVFRHRLELKVSGPGPLLLQRLDLLTRQLAPLHVERVHMAATEGGDVLATLTLFTFSQERAWLEL